MTWTYAGDPSANNRDEVRFLVGDTDTTDQLITDEEIAYAVAEESSNRGAAALVARAIAASFARRADRSVGDLKVSYKQRYDNYIALATSLESKAAVSDPVPFAGGISVSNKDALQDDTDRVKPSIARGLHDNTNSNLDTENENLCD